VQPETPTHKRINNLNVGACPRRKKPGITEMKLTTKMLAMLQTYTRDNENDNGKVPFVVYFKMLIARDSGNNAWIEK
jgi:hypothetical protein